MNTQETTTHNTPNLPPHLKKQGGWAMADMLGATLFSLIMLAGVGLLFSNLYENNNLADTEQALSTLRMEIKQLYTSSPDYAGLTTASAKTSGIIPKKMEKSNGIRNVWNGAVTVEAGVNPNTFVIGLAEVPQGACTKLATYQSGSWVEVKVNGSTLNQNSIVSEAAAQCTNTNTLTFTSN
ncbi:type 4 pilus major pilin [Halodesulfovibrio marinisediminis]|uniref:PilS N terminal n=1 Tax=Halodesulfovibrio marinisediminis DSM 17456 TaxID=1121457 RepID=A0A1N6FEE5_9BACT|nr:type 4 pilus major pilin [Halodesulfovibrio marinisediminis]SIN93629.1 PilS N terminal [Halodesulfovibrio marinisediminis DSM 17456]